MYGLEGNSLHEVLAGSPVYGSHGPDAPKEMGHRYLSEDVPYLLVPVSKLGKTAGVPTPVIDSIILLAGAANGTDYTTAGWTVENLGIRGMSKQSIIESCNKSRRHFYVKTCCSVRTRSVRFSMKEVLMHVKRHSKERETRGR
jgi:opine dehydrogenase